MKKINRTVARKLACLLQWNVGLDDDYSIDITWWSGADDNNGMYGVIGEAEHAQTVKNKTKQNVYIYTAPGSKATSTTSHAAAIPGGQPTPQR